MHDFDIYWLHWKLIEANNEWFLSGISLSVIGIVFSVLGFVFILYRVHQQQKQLIIFKDNCMTITTYSKWLFIGIFVVSIVELIVEMTPSFQRFQQLSEELEVSQIVLGSFLKIIEKKQVPFYERETTIHKITKRYKDLMLKATHLSSEELEMAQLIRQAKKYLKTGQFEQAEKIFNLASHLEMDKNKWVSSATFLALNGELQNLQLSYWKAGEYYEKAADLLPIGNDKTVANYLNEAGMAFDDGAIYVNLYYKPISLYERAIVVKERLYNHDHPSIAVILNRLAELHLNQMNYDQAKSLLERALAINEKFYGTEHPNIAKNINNLTFFYLIKYDYDKVKHLYEKLLIISNKLYLDKKELKLVAIFFSNLSLFYKEQGHYARAQSLIKKALQINEKIYGKEHPNIAHNLERLASLYEIQGDYKRARIFYKRALKIYNKAYDSNHAFVRMCRNSYKNLLYKMFKRWITDFW